jgi:hypothetical protein
MRAVSNSDAPSGALPIAQGFATRALFRFSWKLEKAFPHARLTAALQESTIAKDEFQAK